MHKPHLSHDISSSSAHPEVSHPSTLSASAPAGSRPLPPGSSNLKYRHPPSAANKAFSAARLPRSSSLLPPPHLAPAQPGSATVAQSQLPNGGQGKRPQTPPRTTTAASSTSPSNESLWNLNRWSASTGSSHASASTPRGPGNRFSRRRSSADAGAGAGASLSPPSTRQSPRKLQKSRRPSTSSINFRTEDNPPSVLPWEGSLPAVGLPPIVSLPSLEQTVPSEISQLKQQGTGPSLTERRRSSVPRQPSQSRQYPSNKDSSNRSAESSERPATAASFRGNMQYDQDPKAYQPQGHSRNRSGKSSTDSKGRGVKPPSQKVMLSRALQKANTAVQLDNAQNFEGARQAYDEACTLLQQVLQRTSGEEDKRKLEAIRRTYTSRIDELDQMAPWQDEDDKALPARPDSEIHRPDSLLQFDDDDEPEDVAIVEAAAVTAPVTRIVRDDSHSPRPPQLDLYQSQQRPSDLKHRRDPSRDKLQPIVTTTLQAPNHGLLQSAFSRSPVRLRAPDNLTLQRPDNSAYVPAPLSPRRPISPEKPHHGDSEVPARTDSALRREPPAENRVPVTHLREDSMNSWLDPIDESGGSTTSSVHSRTSSLNIRRKHIRAPSGETEAEFDTALDAAIEAAYDDGYEPMDSDDFDAHDNGDDIIANAMRKVELARERVRQTELEVQESARELQTQYPWSPKLAEFYDDNSSDEEERILEEMERDFGVGKNTTDQTRKQPVPRESDSSGLTSRTWHSSSGSNPPTGTPSLSTVTEISPHSTMPKNSAPSAPPPTHSLPELPPQRPGSAAQSVRNRRLSGQNPKQLKIETTKLTPAMPNHQENSSYTRSAASVGQETDTTGSATASRSANGTRRLSSPHLDVSPSDARLQPSPFGHLNSIEGEDGAAGRSASPSTKKLKKNFSSSSLRSMRNRNMSLSNLDEGSDMSPSTPSSNHYGLSRVPTVPAVPTPTTGAISGGGLHLFDDSILSPTIPGSPNPVASDAPVPLEPCPIDVTLRPFWLMRCLYQTLAHPRGGYLSTKLFVPRDVWRVRGVKLKNIEEKVANCDFLTAALLKINQVDTCDADAVLVEMQSFEGVLEQVQANLSRKLGNEVGVQSSSILFKEASAVDENNSGVPRSTSVSGKPSSFSWRRLRPKNSGVGLGGAYNSRFGGQDAGRETPSLSTLPMTPNPTSRPAKRDVSQVQFSGPNAMYMNALARLFDAAQAIDGIARQVEDPGLRHADKTQVGLELCTRHAAEFFSFYICRFVLADLSILLDKFIKRGSEWVLA